jgi:hypothetical protein
MELAAGGRDAGTQTGESDLGYLSIDLMTVDKPYIFVL